MGLVIHVDGGARGNPGPAGAGVVIRDDQGTLVYEAGFFLGHQTNNFAEYQALIRALERSARCAPQPIVIYSDSELLVRQITGAYHVRSPNLGPLHQQVQALLLKVTRWSIQHICREQNTRADQLVNLAIDRRQDVIVFDADAAPDGAREPSPEPASAHCSAAPTPLFSAETPPECRSGVRITVTRPPGAGQCPAGAMPETAFTIDRTLPAGLCVHAAFALLPTLLAILNTEAGESGAVPTLTVRCARPGCQAEFQLSPVRSTNGVPRGGG